MKSTRSFDSIVKQNKDMVFNLLFRLTGDFHLAEDLFQEVFLRIYKTLSSFRGKSRLSTWIYSIAINVYREHKRKRWQKRFDSDGLTEDMESRPDSGPSPEEILIQKEEKEALQKSLDLMKHTLKIPTVLYYLERLSVSEISAVTGRTENDIKVSLYRARKFLRRNLPETHAVTKRQTL